MVQRVAALGASPAQDATPAAPGRLGTNKVEVSLALGGFVRDNVRDWFERLGPARDGKPGVLRRMADAVLGSPREESSQQTLAKLQTRLDVMYRRRDELTSEIASLDGQISRKEAQIAELAARRSELRGKLEANVALQGDLRTRLDDIDAQLGRAKGELAGLFGQQRSLTVRAGLADLALEDSRRRMDKAATPAQKVAARKEVEAKRVEASRATAATHDMARRIEDLEGRIEELQADRASAERQLDAATIEQRQWAAEFAAIVEQECQAVAGRDALVAVREEKRQELRALNVDIGALEREIQRKQDERRAEERRLLEKAYEERRYLEKYLEKKRDLRDLEGRRLAALYDARRTGEKDHEGLRLEAAYLAARAQARTQQGKAIAAAQVSESASAAPDPIIAPVPADGRVYVAIDNGSLARMREDWTRRRQAADNASPERRRAAV